jgi:hypothetical protein
VVAAYQGLEAKARVRSFSSYTVTEDFEGIPVDKHPLYWVKAGNAKSPIRFIVKQDGDNKVLAKPHDKRGTNRGIAYIGHPDAKGYVIQADVKGLPRKRFRPSPGLYSHGYIMTLLGNHQRLKIFNWISEDARFSETISFKWDPEVWYTMKMRVDYSGGKAIVKGKVWQAGTEEPAEWTISAEDPHPIPDGSPGLYGHSTADIYFDNIKITEKSP